MEAKNGSYSERCGTPDVTRHRDCPVVHLTASARTDQCAVPLIMVSAEIRLFAELVVITVFRKPGDDILVRPVDLKCVSMLIIDMILNVSIRSDFKKYW